MSTRRRQSKDEGNEYEAKRLGNIARNNELLAGLGINVETSAMRVQAPAKAKVFSKPVKRQQESEPVRRSTRGKDSAGNIIAPPREVENFVEKHVTPGPVDMREGGSELSVFADQLMELAATKTMTGKRAKSLVKYSKLTLGNETACSIARVAPRVKVVKERIFSMSFHPSPDTPMLVAGDKWGQVGFLDLRPGKDESKRVFALSPHARPISGLIHSTEGQALFSCSYDGTVRRFDYHTGIFELLFHKEDEMFSHICSSSDGSSLFVAGSTGDVYIIDPRVSSASDKPARHLDLHDRKVSTVDAHPTDAHLFVTASNDQTVKMWDVRKTVRSKPLALLSHTLAVTSAYFAPALPHTVVTTCNDNLLRFWNPQATDSHLVQVKHNNNTGRYITNFRAVWDPNSSVVLIGNMNKKLDVYDMNGNEIASVSHDLCSAIPAVNVAHATLALVASGNGSGYVNVWGPYE
jgi:hypothetical protein